MKQMFMQGQKIDINSEAATGGVLLKKVFLKMFASFTEKHLLESLFNKFAGLQVCRTARTPILKNICEQLLLSTLS